MSEWIPVSERLPESSVYVLVITNNGTITTGIIRESNNKKFWWHRMYEFKEKEIVAWMPLPEPLKTLSTISRKLFKISRKLSRIEELLEN